MNALSTRLGLVFLLLCRCSSEPMTLAPDAGVMADMAGCDTFACRGVLAYGDKAPFSVATPCVGYKTNLRPSPVCEGCACVTAKSDCVVIASTWADATCSTTLVDLETVGTNERLPMSTFDRINGYAKVNGAATKCVVDTAVKGGPAYASDDEYICNYFGPCSDLKCAAASEAQCLLLAGNVSCPAAFPQKEVAFASVEDKRSCTCDCAGAPGSCAVPPNVAVAAISALGITTTLTTTCKAHGNTGSAPPNNVALYSLGVLAPACVSAGKSVSGTIEVRDYKTVCCR